MKNIMSFMKMGWQYETIGNGSNSLLDFERSYKSGQKICPLPEPNDILISPDMNENLISHFITSVSPMYINITFFSIMCFL
jgi:hypothetical protein